MLADRSPFEICCEDAEETVQVAAVLDLRKDPLWMRSELSNR